MTLLTMGALMVMPVLGTSQAEFQTLFEAGNYQQLVEAVESAPADVAGDPAVLFLKALSQDKLSQAEAAARTFGEIAAGRDEGDAWRAVGESGRLLVQGQTDQALAAATRAVELNGNLGPAHYQRGLALGYAGNFGAAAESFGRVAQIDPSFAYAHYNAGISYYRVKRIDLMASHFEAFLRLAPSAPERGEVESIMRTVRGR